MIAIIHTGGANLASVQNAINRLGIEGELTSNANRIREASHVILPGVGAAADAMARLREADLIDVIKGLEQPVLGICLGMQILFERSTEGDVDCLGIIPGTVTAMTPDVSQGITVPHMGWNNLKVSDPSDPLLAGVTPETYFYFVHSYQAPTGAHVRATTQHGGEVVAAVAHANFYGVQFHPERSASAGAALLKRFFEQ